MKLLFYFLISTSLFAQSHTIVWKDSTGMITITTPTVESKIEGETELEHCERIRQKDATNAVDYIILEVKDLPDIYWQEAWQLNSGVITIDRTKAETIHRARKKDSIRQRAVQGVITFTQCDAQCSAVDLMDLSAVAAPTLKDLKNK